MKDNRVRISGSWSRHGHTTPVTWYRGARSCGDFLGSNFEVPHHQVAIMAGRDEDGGGGGEGASHHGAGVAGELCHLVLGLGLGALS